MVLCCLCIVYIFYSFNIPDFPPLFFFFFFFFYFFIFSFLFFFFFFFFFFLQPLEILINDGSKLTLHGLQQYYVELDEKEKNRKLVDLLDALEFNQLVIFVKSVKRAEHLRSILVDCSFPAAHLTSGMPQAERIETYQKFKDFQYRILVATNLVGRGIDIARINVVINYDMPEGADTYLHRVGRAGRFGTQGLAISFVSSSGDANVLNAVQERFVVNISTLPDEIDAHTYM